MRKKRLTGSAISLASICLLLSSCTGSNRNMQLGVHDARLMPCPSSPNCFSSDDADPDHQTHPFLLAIPAADAWNVARSLVSELPRATIVTETEDYLHAECRSAVFGFVDDLELHLRPAEKMIAVRSAAQVGYSDFGVNRKRIEELRTQLKQQCTLR